MNLPLMVMRIIIDSEDKHVNLWLPLFVIVPIGVIILVALFLLLLPLILIVALILWFIGLRRPVQMFIPAIRAVSTILFALRGFKIDIDQEDKRVLISFS